MTFITMKKKRLFLILITLLTISGCKKSESPPKQKASEEPLIGVVTSDGRTIYSSDEYQQPPSDIIPEQVIIPTMDPVRSDLIQITPVPTSSITQSIDVASGTVTENADRSGAITFFQTAVKNSLNEYLGNNYTADFGADSAVITMYGISKTEQEIQKLERQLSESATGMGLYNYKVTINVQNETDQTIVWLPGGDWDDPKWEPKYHSIPNCGNMNPDKAIKKTLEEVKSRGCQPCSKCW